MKNLFERFFDALPDYNLEPNTLRTMKTHQRHFIRLLKANFPVSDLSGHDLQKYVKARSKNRTQYERSTPGKSKATKRKVSATTIKNEIVTLGTVWRWCIRRSKSVAFGSDADEVIKQLNQHGIPRGLVKKAMELASEQGGFTVFALVDALTRLSQTVNVAGDRAALDTKIGSLLSLAV
ncbi:MAG: hypothetical protein AB8B50_13270 [Pirellulaceae bacterium]